jgi:hypothetical protein
MTCSIDGCSNPTHARGLCSTHNRRVILYGSPNTTKNRPPGTGFFALGYKATQIDGVKRFDHVRIAEKALGRTLPKGAVVHHDDGSRDNNENSNLVICPDRAYHNMLHARINALEASGDANKKKCKYCGNYDHQEIMHEYKRKTSSAFWHKECGKGAKRKQYMQRGIK